MNDGLGDLVGRGRRCGRGGTGAGRRGEYWIWLLETVVFYATRPQSNDPSFAALKLGDNRAAK